MTTTLDMMSSMEQTIAALTSENARLRGELELWKAAEEMRGRQLAAVARERNAYSEDSEKAEAALAPHRKPGQDTLAVIAALTADLARVTAERDRLLAALQTIAAPGTEHQYSYGVGAEGADYGNGWAVETARAAIAACPPPASGEESE
jgi:uncharacterized small protein (DUF1192 family)